MIRTLLLVLLITASLASGQTITGVSGDIDHGGTIIVIGSSFGVKSPAAPYLWDDFESGTNGVAIGTGSHGLYTTVDNAHYSSSDSYAGGLSSYSARDAAGTLLNPGLHASMAPTEFTTGFISMKWKIVSSAGDLDPHNIKLLRLNSDDPDPTHGFPNYNIGNDRTRVTFYGILNHGSAQQDYVCQPGTDYTYGAWNSLDIWAVCGDADTANGMSGMANNGAACYDNNVVTLLTDGGAGGGSHTGYRQFYWCGYLSGEGYDVDIYLDDVYGDITLARVELSDSAVWSTSTHKELQPPTAWTTTTATVTVNTGQFETGETVYAYLIDENGDVSNGYPLIIGEDGGEDIPFTAPSNLTVTGGN